MSVINREDAIAKIKDIPYVQEHPNIGLLFEEWLKSLPDADDGWIPVEDRPPDNNTDFLLQFKSNMGVGFYEDGDWAINTGEGIYSLVGYNEEKPIAWKPLPPAFKPKEDK